MHERELNVVDAWLEDAIDVAVLRVGAIAAQTVDFPHITERQVWRTTPDGVWTGGFWAGLLWLSHERTGLPSLLERAAHFTDRLLARANDARNHDLGFMFYPSAIKGWERTGDVRHRDAALTAANALARQFNARGEYIPGWGFFGGADWGGLVLIDTLMNLPLLVWAARHGGDVRLIDVMERHAATSLRHQMRPDGSVSHMFRFDPVTGAPLAADTYQGLSPDSSWARGQAWAMTGLAILAKMTGAARYREASERVAEYFRSRLPEDGVPPWDFTADGPREPKDSSAAAIASYGFQKLYQATADRRHLHTATMLLQALAATCANRSDAGGLLLHATADLPHGLGIDESTMYGDYYYLKSLMLRRATGLQSHD
jgi:unsaturated chondroitin disaccharide hydrolase